jgi:hypothetical protein
VHPAPPIFRKSLRSCDFTIARAAPLHRPLQAIEPECPAPVALT